MFFFQTWRFDVGLNASELIDSCSGWQLFSSGMAVGAGRFFSLSNLGLAPVSWTILHI